MNSDRHEHPKENKYLLLSRLCSFARIIQGTSVSTRKCFVSCKKYISIFKTFSQHALAAARLYNSTHIFI